MLIKGSTKISFTPKLALVLIIASFVISQENIVVLNGKILIILVIFITFIGPIIESILLKHETISLDSENIYFDLKKYVGDIKIKNINKIYLNENVNHLTLETDSSRHFFKLFGFSREKIQNLVNTIESKNK